MMPKINTGYGMEPFFLVGYRIDLCYGTWDGAYFLVGHVIHLCYGTPKIRIRIEHRSVNSSSDE